MELLKDVVGSIIEEMEENEKDTDSLEDAIDAMDDAFNAIGVAIDELEEEELRAVHRKRDSIGITVLSRFAVLCHFLILF